MADTGRRMTDAEFRRLRAKIKGVYQEAYEDIYKKNLDFVKRHERREAQYRQMMDEGKITKTDFDMWMRGQVFQGKQWEAKRKQMEATLLNADQMAMDMINGSRVRVFADNANFIGYELEQHGRVDTSFGLYDINSVKRLLMEEPDLLPPRKVGKDASYKWYNRQIQGAVTQGIIQGEKLTDIAKRIGQATGNRLMNNMLLHARTMHTGAECAGRIEGMHQAQRLGIEVKKKWLATLDNHTRDSHRKLDGDVKEVDEPFISEMGKIMFPGDPNAQSPADVWNCRCSLTYVYPKYPDSMVQRRDNITGEVIDDMTYREWEAMKRIETVTPQIDPFTIVNGRDITQTWERRPDKFDFEINDVIDAQGFDGLPQVVDANEFDKAVQDSNFVAMRGYHGPDQETLEAYRDALYHGDWYVDCSNGGAMFGQGMYAAANFHGNASGQVKSVGDSYSGGTGFVETFTMVKDTNFVQYDDINAQFNGAIIPQSILTKAIDDLNDDELTLFKYNLGDKSVTWKDVSMAFERAGSEGNKKVSDRLMNAWAQTRNEADANRTKYGNVGVYAAAKGYDAIVCDDRDKDGVYVVILNRTKVIFRRP